MQTSSAFNPYQMSLPDIDEDVYHYTIDRILFRIHNNNFLIHNNCISKKTELLQILKRRIERLDAKQYLFIPFYLTLRRVTEKDLFAYLSNKLIITIHRYNFFDIIKKANLNISTKANDYIFDDFIFDLKKIIENLEANFQKQAILIFIIDELDIMNTFSNKTRSMFKSIFLDFENIRIIAAATKLEVFNKESFTNFLMIEKIQPIITTREQAIKAIQEPVIGIFRYTTKAIEKIIEYTNKEPYKIQNYCYELINSAREKKKYTISDEDVEAIHKNISVYL
ncbi:MAG: hypothetical protein ACFFDN_37440 [Candidatus Hodarchaeota archaeon]